MTREETQILNEALFERLGSRAPILEKQAVDAVNDFTRAKMREDGFYRRIMPPVPVSNDDLTHLANLKDTGNRSTFVYKRAGLNRKK